MMISPEIKASIKNSVLCWLATVSEGGQPNVSPKEVFSDFGDSMVIVANIASPQTVRNIRLHNPRVCISFVDVLVQKGFQLKGTARIVKKADAEFAAMHAVLEPIAGKAFPFSTITVISVEQVKPIISPKYVLYPETTEADQIASARKTYGF